VKIVWLPGFYEAGIAISDDPDNGTWAQFKGIYDLLYALGLPTTRAMWVFDPVEPTGTPPLPVCFHAPLLAEKACLEYCRRLHAGGFEICLHGASSGNNTRGMMIKALEFLEREIGGAQTYICHSKNAENLYWDRECASSSFLSLLLGLYTKNRCFGEVEGSPYFWGDLARSKISYVRLFRTRRADTLAVNPSMPYHDFRKPYVNFWFSASKGYLPRLFDPASVGRLCAENGASIVYQYLHKYVDIEGRIDPAVRSCLERLASDSRILFRPVSILLNRLKQFQTLFPLTFGGKAYLINASRRPVESVQIGLENGETLDPASSQGIASRGAKINIGTVGPLSVRPLPLAGVRAKAAPYRLMMHGDIAELRFPLGCIIANCSSDPRLMSDRFGRLTQKFLGLEKLDGNGVAVFYKTREAKRLEILRPVPPKELGRLLWGQMKILLREHLVLGRKISSAAYLKNPGEIEDQSNW